MEILQQLGINWMLLLGYFVNFLILFFVLNKFVIQKALKNIEARQKMTADLLTNSDKAQKALEDAKLEFNKIVAEANTKAQEIVGKSDKSAKTIADEITAKAQSQAEDILKRAQQNIKDEHTNLRKELEREIGILVIDTVEKVIGELPEDQKKKITTKIDNEFTTK